MVVFNSGQKIALRAFYFIRALTKALTYYYINRSQRHLLAAIENNWFGVPITYIENNSRHCAIDAMCSSCSIPFIHRIVIRCLILTCKVILESILPRTTVENTNNEEASWKVAWYTEYFSLWRLNCSADFATLHEAKPGQYFLLCILYVLFIYIFFTKEIGECVLSFNFM